MYCMIYIYMCVYADLPEVSDCSVFEVAFEYTNERLALDEALLFLDWIHNLVVGWFCGMWLVWANCFFFRSSALNQWRSMWHRHV